MRGQDLAAWEIRSAVLSSRASTLEDTAKDKALELTPDERRSLVDIGQRLRSEAYRVVREG